MVGRMIRQGIEPCDERIILLRSAFDFEAIVRSVVGRADQFVPVSLRRFAARSIRDEVFQMGAPVLIAQERHELRVRIERNILGIVHCVQVGNERDRDPVISRDSRVAADDCSVLSRVAAPQCYGRRGADPCQVDRGVAGSCKGSVVAIRLFEQDSDVRLRPRREARRIIRKGKRPTLTISSSPTRLTPWAGH